MNLQMWDEYAENTCHDKLNKLSPSLLMSLFIRSGSLSDILSLRSTITTSYSQTTKLIKKKKTKLQNI